MSKWNKIAGLVFGLALAAIPALAQEAAKKESPKPALGTSAKLLSQWNDIGGKLIAIAEDLPEDKYDYKPNPDSRSFIEQLMHTAGSMYYFNDVTQGKKARYGDGPKRDQ